jgi:tripartite-type tricarboxylate transporter receptor subunit TctC
MMITIRLAASLVLVLALCLSTTAVQAQSYPSKPIKIIVPFAAGGITDFLGRMAADYISSKSGQPVIVENRSGSSGTIGIEAVAKSAPDGYTLALASAGDIVVNPFLYKHLSTNPLTELVPIALIADAPQLLVINSKVPARTLQEFIAYVKANPGKLHYGSAGHGSTIQLGSGLFSRLASVEMQHVPYRGATPALTDMLAGRIEMMHISLQPVASHVQAGTLRILCVTLPERWTEYLPEVPTSQEAGLPGYEMALWFGLVAPRATPQPIIDQLNGYMRSMLTEEGPRKRLVDAYLRPARPQSAREFQDFIQQEVPKWERMVRDTGVTLD